MNRARWLVMLAQILDAIKKMERKLTRKCTSFWWLRGIFLVERKNKNKNHQKWRKMWSCQLLCIWIIFHKWVLQSWDLQTFKSTLKKQYFLLEEPKEKMWKKDKNQNYIKLIYRFLIDLYLDSMHWFYSIMRLVNGKFVA